MSKITDAVTSLAEPVAERHGCELWDVEFSKEGGSSFLRVYIDAPGGVSVSHCEAVSRELDPILDEHEALFPGSYIFEVSSPGAERRLQRPSDFTRFAGSTAEIKLYMARGGQKSFTGTLAGWEDGAALLDISGELHKFEKSEIAGAKLRCF